MLNTQYLPDPQVTIVSLKGSDQILSRADLSRQRSILILKRPSGLLSLVTAERDTTGNLTRILGCLMFQEEGLDVLDKALFVAKKTIEVNRG